jgi:hypothetical protein
MVKEGVHSRVYEGREERGKKKKRKSRAKK